MTENHRPLISVVIPTYNHGRFIGNAIQSVLQQTYDKFEIIIIDNYSEDNTEEIVKSFSDHRIRYTKFRNKGIIAASRNVGIKMSSGTLVAFLDSDDVWYPLKLEKVENAFRNNKDIILVSHNESWVKNGRIIKEKKYGPFVQDMYFSLLFKKNCISPSATVVKKDVLLKTNGFTEKEEFIGCEDYEYWLRLSREGGFHLIDDVLGEYRLYGNNFVFNPVRLANTAFNVLDFHYSRLSKEEQVKFKNRFAVRRARVMASCAKTLYLNRDVRSVSWGYRAIKEILKSIVQ